MVTLRTREGIEHFMINITFFIKKRSGTVDILTIKTITFIDNESQLPEKLHWLIQG